MSMFTPTPPATGPASRDARDVMKAVITAAPAAYAEAVNALVALLVVGLQFRARTTTPLLAYETAGLLVLMVFFFLRLVLFPGPTPTLRTTLVWLLGTIMSALSLGTLLGGILVYPQLIDRAEIDPGAGPIVVVLAILAVVLLLLSLIRSRYARSLRVVTWSTYAAAAALALESMAQLDDAFAVGASLLLAIGTLLILMVVDSWTGLIMVDTFTALRTGFTVERGSSHDRHDVRMLMRATSIGVGLASGLLAALLLPDILGVHVGLTVPAIAAAVVGFVLSLAIAVLLPVSDRETPSS